MLKTIFIVVLPFLALFGNSGLQPTGLNPNDGRGDNSGTLEKMIVANGNVAIDLDLNKLNGTAVGSKGSKTSVLNFDVEHDSFFTVIVFNDELRGPMPSTMAIIPKNALVLPAKLNSSLQQLVLEKTGWGEQHELAIRDAKTGFIFFNIEGHQFEYDARAHQFTITSGKLLMSKEFAADLGRPADSGVVIGKISVTATMRDIEVSKIKDNEVLSDSLPSLNPEAGSAPGPDVIVGDLNGLAQFDGAAGGQVGLAVGTDSCNLGVVNLDWFQTPDNNHPVIPQNMYRMSGGATNDQTFEQIGQSNVKHAFTALQENICSLGCNGVGGTHLGSGCSDPYVASLNSGQSTHNLGSRAWINPFTGGFPRGDSATPPNVHTGHTHTGPAHRILVNISDLDTSQNAGASYYAEAMYVTPHEYVWCQAHAGECNQYNNVSYRRYVVSGTASPFSFSTGGFTTQRQKAAITAWTGATLVPMQPDPGNDGIGSVSYKVTQTSPGVWHYEYAVYNQNMDRAIQSFSIPLGNGVTLTNVGFHAPPQQPGWAADGTVGNTGFSNTAWAQSQAGGAMTWSSETLAQNANANAIRWGTMYNFRFDSNQPPTAMSATVGFFKTGAPITVQVQGPAAAVPTGPFGVGGRVLNAVGQGYGNAKVTLTDASSNARVTYTSPLGYYQFDNVTGGGTYTVSVKASRTFTYSPQNIQVNSDMETVDFSPAP